MQKPLITILLLIIGLSVATKIKSFIKNNAPEHVVPVEEVKETETVICTMDAMMCPDGSYVGRTGLKCEFVCPDVTATSTTVKATLGLNEPFDFNGMELIALAVTEDSRCPSDVTCIQSGRAKVALNVGSSTAEIEEGQTIAIESLSITLDQVVPYPVSTRKTADDEYRFSFSVRPQ
ncbi:MAG: hypothetical protein AAB610_02195 [Patescibacteria group bacterium]